MKYTKQSDMNMYGASSSGRTAPVNAPARPGDARMPVEAGMIEIDRQWSGLSSSGRNIFEYYDYYFTGEDVRVYIDGLDPPDSDAHLPMMDFAFKITQQKAPVYGFWSYTYDAVLRGSRMVQGAFRIATTSTDYMTRVLGKAAENRAAGLSDTRMRPYTVDEQNVENYWGRHIEPGKNIDNNIFSIHPPFNFVAVYGINDTVFAMPPRPDSQSQYVIDKYNTGYGTLSNDDNHTILEADQENNIMRRIIESVEIIDMQVEYNTSGQVCSEVYTFMARDAYSPMPPREVPSQTRTPLASETEEERIVGGAGGGSVQF